MENSLLVRHFPVSGGDRRIILRTTVVTRLGPDQLRLKAGIWIRHKV